MSLPKNIKFVLGAKRGMYSLRVHDDRYSPHELIVYPSLLPLFPLRSLVQIGGTLVLQVHDEIQPSTPGQTPYISVLRHIAQAFDLKVLSDVTVRLIEAGEAVLDMVELNVKDHSLNRSDQWRIKLALVGTCVYCSKRLVFGSLRLVAKRLYANGTCTSGVVSLHTRIVFRSESAHVYILVQLANEMWTFAEDGDLYHEKAIMCFLPDLFSRWKEESVNHCVTLVLFARVYDSSKYRDYYKVVVDMEYRSDWSTILPALRGEVLSFPTHVGAHSSSFACAHQGNILEAVNLALNPHDKHYVERDIDFACTGLAFILVTPGIGYFEADKKLLRLTEQRMLDNGVYLDIVCMSAPPLHVTPLARFSSTVSLGLKRPKSSPNSLSHSSLSGSTPNSQKVNPFLERETEKLHLQCWSPLYYDSAEERFDDPHFFFFDLLDWVDIGHYMEKTQFVPRCRIPTVQFNGVPLVSPIGNLETYDEEIFEKFNNVPALFAGTKHACDSPDCGEWSTFRLTMEAISAHPECMLHRNFYAVDAVQAGDVDLPPITQKALQALVQMNSYLISPWKNNKKSVAKRWEHAYPPGHVHNAVISWKALCTPACLPVTTESLPTKEELLQLYKEYTYTVSPSDTSFEHLLQEMVSIRLAQGFQILLTGDTSTDVFLTMSNQLHRITVSENQITVKRFVRKLNYKTSWKFSCASFHWVPDAGKFEKRLTVFKYPEQSLLNLNLVDHMISSPCITDSAHLYTARLIYLPIETPQFEGDARTAGFQRFLEVLQKYVHNEDTLQVHCNLEGRASIFLKELLRLENEIDLKSTSYIAPQNETCPWHSLQEFPFKSLTSKRFSYNPDYTLPKGKRLSRTQSCTFRRPTPHPLHRRRSIHSCTFMEFEKFMCPEKKSTRKRQDLMSYVRGAFSEQKSFSPQISNPEDSGPVERFPYHFLVHLAMAMQNPETGISFRNRKWNYQEYQNVFVGSEAVDWFLKYVEGLYTREQATEFGMELLKSRVFTHCRNIHGFIDGFFYYKLRSDLHKHKLKPVDPGTLTLPQCQCLIQNQVPPVLMSQRTILNVDIGRSSDRQEHVIVHMDRFHNPNYTYKIQIHWLNCTTYLMCEMLNVWGRAAEKNGLKQVLVPTDLVKLLRDDSPFHVTPTFIPLISPPPLNPPVPNYYEVSLVKKFGFIIDTEGDYKVQRNKVIHLYERWVSRFTLYVHRSGSAFIILQTDDETCILFVQNPVYLATGPQRSRDEFDQHSLRKNISEFCSNKNKLQSFWREAESAISSQDVQDQLKEVRDQERIVTLLQKKHGDLT